MKKKCEDKCCQTNVCMECSTRIESLSVNYSNRTAVDGISFGLSCGELTAIIGPNGGGKTSILRAILGEVDYSGKISFCSHGGENRKIRIGYVPQKISIMPDSPISVFDLMLLSEGYLPTWLRVSSAKKRDLTKLLSLVSAENLAKRKVGELSGGELQRVLLAAALNPIPELLLLDEPVSALDARGSESFYNIICDLRKMFHVSIVVVTHDIGAIAKHADKMILVNRKILASGHPSDVLKSQPFISQMGLYVPDFSKGIADIHVKR